MEYYTPASSCHASPVVFPPTSTEDTASDNPRDTRDVPDQPLALLQGCILEPMLYMYESIAYIDISAHAECPSSVNQVAANASEAGIAGYMGAVELAGGIAMLDEDNLTPDRVAEQHPGLPKNRSQTARHSRETTASTC